MADKNDRDQPNRRAHPVLEYYTWRFTDQLTPKEKQILAAMSDDLYKLVRAAFEMAQDQLSPPDGLLPGYEDHSVFRTRVRRDEPALESLSDQELDVALNAVRRLGSDGHAVENSSPKPANTRPLTLTSSDGPMRRWSTGSHGHSCTTSSARPPRQHPCVSCSRQTSWN